MRARLSAILAVFVLECVAGAQKPPWPSAGQDPLVTAVAGPSWLTHLGLKLNRTSLGQGAHSVMDPVQMKKPTRHTRLSVYGNRFL